MQVQFGAVRLSQLQDRLQDGPVTLINQQGYQRSLRVPGSGRLPQQQWLPTELTVSQVVQADISFPDEDATVDWPFLMLNFRDNNGELGVSVNVQKARRRADGDYVFRNLDFKA